MLSDEFAGTIGLTLIIAFQLIAFAWIYGFPQVRRDLAKMWGEPRPLRSPVRWIDRHSPIWLFSWTVTCPICAVIIAYLLTHRIDNYIYKIEVHNRLSFPAWATVLGFVSTLGPLLCLPVFFFYNWFREMRKSQKTCGKAFLALFKNLPEVHERSEKQYPHDTPTTVSAVSQAEKGKISITEKQSHVEKTVLSTDK